MGSFNPASEKRMLDKLNKIETMLEQFASSRKISTTQSASDVNNPEHSSMKFDYGEDDDDFNSSLAERLGKYKAFQQNPELIDFFIGMGNLMVVSSLFDYLHIYTKRSRYHIS